ncbi:MAG TPA: hypothetical protein DCZ88_12145, partial [Pseudanabaena sp.]|nr:hypothetical protein [Pseudanabaena sp.]
MLTNRINLMAMLIGLIVMGCGSPEATNSLPTPTNSITTTKAVSSSPTISASPKVSAETTMIKEIAVGDIKEIDDSSICGKSQVTYAYGETSNYRVYICADASAPERPRYYISRNKDGSGGLDLEAMNYNPKKSGKIEFKNDGYIYTLEASTTQNPEPVLRVTFPNGKLSEEKLLRYLDRSGSSNTTTTIAPNVEPLQYVLDNRENLKVCKDTFRAEDVNSGMGSKVFQISDKKYLVQIQCFLAAYQGNFEYVLWIDDAPKPRAIPLEFDSFQEGKNGEKPKRTTDRSIAGVPRFNVRSQTLTNFTKFRGIGDCASSAVYKLDGDRMVLQEFRA